MLILSTGLSSFDNTFELIGLVVIFIIILIAAYFISRWVGGASLSQFKNKNIKIIETMRISPNKYLQIIKIGDKYIVVAVTKDHISFLTEVSEDGIDITADDNVSPIEFKDIMNKLMKREQKNKYNK